MRRRKPTLRRPYSLRRGTRRLPFFRFPERGMERREGARGLAKPPLAGLGETRRAPWRGARPLGEAGCAPRALHPSSSRASRASLTAMRIVGAPRLVRCRASLEMTRDAGQGGYYLANDRNKVKRESSRIRHRRRDKRLPRRMSTLPNCRMRFLPSFRLSSSLRLRIAPPFNTPCGHTFARRSR